MPSLISVRINALNDALPQTQCTRCGYPDCRSYAQAIVSEQAPINRCPPGGAEGVARLAALTGQPVTALDPACGEEGPRRVAIIDETWCIGCTLCIKACPVDCIVGMSKHMHTVIEAQCTGCELCVPACPVDCIALEEATPGRSGWSAWSPEEAAAARRRHDARTTRVARAAAADAERQHTHALDKLAHLDTLTHAAAPDEQARKRRVIEAVLAKSKMKKDGI